MLKTLLVLGGMLVLTVISVAGALWLANAISSKPEDKSDTSHESMTAAHSGPTNLSEAKIQDLTRLRDVSVSIIGADFSPNNIQIRKGTKVTWTNNASENHAIMEENGKEMSHDSTPSSNVKESVLSGPTLAKDKSYEFTFNATGQFYYHCPLHPNIRGKVTVVE